MAVIKMNKMKDRTAPKRNSLLLKYTPVKPAMG